MAHFSFRGMHIACKMSLWREERKAYPVDSSSGSNPDRFSQFVGLTVVGPWIFVVWRICHAANWIITDCEWPKNNSQFRVRYRILEVRVCRKIFWTYLSDGKTSLMVKESLLIIKIVCHRGNRKLSTGREMSQNDGGVQKKEGRGNGKSIRDE